MEQPFKVGDTIRANRTLLSFKKNDEFIVTFITYEHQTWWVGFGDMKDSNWEYDCFDLVEEKLEPKKIINGWGF